MGWEIKADRNRREQFHFLRNGRLNRIIGAAANESIKTGKIIDIDEFIGDATLLDK